MKKFIKYIIAFSISFIFFAIICLAKDIFNQKNPVDVFHILVDASFVPGVLLICFGLLIFVSNEGAFDMLVYGVKRFANLFKKDPTKIKFKTFYDYKESLRGKKTEFLFLILTGILYVGISMILLIFYFQ